MTTVKEPPVGPGISPPPSSAETPQNSDRSKDDNRCEFTSSNGRRCRSQRAQFCVDHASKRNDVGAEGAPDDGLAGLCADLTTATNINRALSHVFLLMAQGRISQKQAVAFGYLGQLLLQTVPGIRAEFVSAYGYKPWEARLKDSLAPNGKREEDTEQEVTSSEDPPDSPPPLQLPVPEEHPSKPTEPDFAGVYSRSLDLFAGKYDTTPEGRREARALALDIELMKPPDSKPARGRVGETASLIRRIRAGKSAPTVPQYPWLDSLGQPIKTAYKYRCERREGSDESAAPQCNTAPAPQPPPIAAAPSNSPPQSAASDPRTECQPTVSVLSTVPTAPARETPVPWYSELFRAPEPVTRLDWLPPKSKSAPPIAATRAEKFVRKLRNMSNYRLRHLQHQNF